MAEIMRYEISGYKSNKSGFLPHDEWKIGTKTKREYETEDFKQYVFPESIEELEREIKVKYCPFTRKVVKNKTQKEFLKKNEEEIIEKFELSEETKKHEQKYVDNINEMKEKRKSWRSVNNRFLVDKLDIPLENLKELKRKYLYLK
ncbi:hypothetical protein ES705_08467 [subsurface metagenome]